jgi:hypothetical protein
MPSKKSKRKRMDRNLRWNQMHDWFYRDGWGLGEIANELNMSVRLVRKILRKENIPARMTRAHVLKELLPGLNALFGLEYAKLELSDAV